MAKMRSRNDDTLRDVQIRFASRTGEQATARLRSTHVSCRRPDLSCISRSWAICRSHFVESSLNVCRAGWRTIMPGRYRIGTAGALSPVSPVAILRYSDSRKWTDGVIRRPAHGEISGSREALLFDVFLLAIGEDALIGFEHREPGRVCDGDAHVAADNLQSPPSNAAAIVASQFRSAMQSASMKASMGALETLTPLLRAGPGPGVGSCSRRTLGTPRKFRSAGSSSRCRRQ